MFIHPAPKTEHRKVFTNTVNQRTGTELIQFFSNGCIKWNSASGEFSADREYRDEQSDRYQIINPVFEHKKFSKLF